MVSHERGRRCTSIKWVNGLLVVEGRGGSCRPKAEATEDRAIATLTVFV